jgi:hypothetical protein
MKEDQAMGQHSFMVCCVQCAIFTPILETVSGFLIGTQSAASATHRPLPCPGAKQIIVKVFIPWLMVYRP